MIAPLLAWLDGAALVAFGVPITWAEVLGDVAGAACVVLVVRQNILSWPIGLLNNVFWGWLFYRAKLYGDSSLQGVFFVLGLYGWWRWAAVSTRARGSRASTTTGSVASGGPGPKLPVRRTRASEWRVLAVGLAISTTAVAAFLAGQTDSPAPVADASVLTLSLAATWGQAQKLLESWWLWIAVDVISVPLYASRALYPTAALYVAFGVLCVFGLRAWSRDLAAPVTSP